MKRSLPALGFCVLAPAAAAAQEPPPTYFQTQQQYKVELKFEALARQEWTFDVFEGPNLFINEDRWRLRLRPRLEAAFGPVLVGVGGDFNYSSDRNADPPPLLQRDNYDSRDARLDLAFGSLKLGPLQLQGGRLPMPVPLSEMLWDRDLRPQGGAGSLELRERGSLKSLGATALYAKGKHVFEDGDTTLLLVSGEATFSSTTGSELQLMGSFLRFTEFASEAPLDPSLHRQNTRLPGEVLAGPFEVVDLIARYRRTGQAPLQLQADYCWNRAVEGDNKGLWLALALGAIRTTPARLEYTYAKVDRDATLAAYATDDFFWATGWEGHRADFGMSAGEHSSLHVVGQLQRFKDGPLEVREHWVKRLRLELRFSH